MQIRARTVSAFCAIALVAMSVGAAAADARVRPEPNDGRISSTPPYGVQMAQLIDDQRHAPTLAVRKLIHHEIVQLHIDSRWDDA